MTAHELWLAGALDTLRSQKTTAEKAIAQIDDTALHRRPDETFNSIAVIMRHMAGNMLSRWTDFLTTDGEKPNRNRDSEFTDWMGTRGELMALWERGWGVTLRTIESLSEADMHRTISIRSEPWKVPDAILRQLSHYGYHVGQIVLLARLYADRQRWQWLTIPPGQSEQYNRQMTGR
jgi:uncharacterized damage-inducible protein DinB